MTNSNLSKIKPKLRTTGIVSGNFGRAKVKAGSSLGDIGMTKADKVYVAKPDDYLQRMYDALEKTEEKKRSMMDVLMRRDCSEEEEKTMNL